MKTALNFFGKILIAFLAFLSLQVGSSAAFSLATLNSNSEDSDKNFQSGQAACLTIDPKEYQEVPEPTDKLSDGISNPEFFLSRTSENFRASNNFSHHHRDLRAAISSQIFPTHFFL